MPIRILAFETSTQACSAALWLDGQIIERFEIAPQQHTQLILPMLESLLAEAGLQRQQLDAIAFGRGPGSFTGLRIAASLAQGIAFGLDLPVVPVSTLQALAQGAYRCLQVNHVLTALDARKEEVYWGQYQLSEELMYPLQEDRLNKPEDISVPETDGWVGVGNGWQAYAEILLEKWKGKVLKVEAEFYPHAQDVAVIAAGILQEGKAVPAAEALPVYLRDSIF